MTKKVSELTAAASVAGANEFEINEAGTSKKVTGTQIQTFIQTGLTMAGAVAMAANNITAIGYLDLNNPTTLTIASDAITPTQSYHLIDTEAAAATDNCDTITAGTLNGTFFIFASVSNARDPTFVDGATSLVLAGGNFTLTTISDRLLLQGAGTANLAELARSDNV